MSNDNFSIFEILISQTQLCTIRVRASSEEEALEYIQQNPSVTDDFVWDKPDYEYSLLEVYEDGESFNIDLVEEENEEEPSLGTLILTTAPLDALVVVKDAVGNRHELRIKDKLLVSAGSCSWEIFVDGKVVKNGTYEVFANEWNPLIIK